MVRELPPKILDNMIVWVWSICVVKTDQNLNEKKAVFQSGIPLMKLKKHYKNSPARAFRTVVINTQMEV